LSTSIDQAFIKQFEEEVHQAYQRMGSKLRNTVRVKNGVRGSSTVFQTVGKGSASTKARHGMVPVMNVDHTPVECQLQDFYAGDWIDHLDELKVNIDERQVLANAGAFALGRKTDEMIIAALGQATNAAGSGGDGLTKAKVLEAFEILGEMDVPDDGQRYAVIGWKQWSDLSRSPSSRAPISSGRTSCRGAAPRPNAGSARSGCRTPGSRSTPACAAASGTTAAPSATRSARR
jgi:hypothetical protein